MTIYARYVDFRDAFTKKISIAGTFTVNPDIGGVATILRAAGNFVSDGVQVGMTVQPKGSTFIDGYRYKVSSAWTGSALQTTQLICDAIVGGSGEGPSAFTLSVYQMANDGYEEFPGLMAAEAGRTNLVRAGGFTGGISGFPATFVQGVSFRLTVNAEATDAVSGTHEYDWYLSQRTDDAAKQYLSIGAYSLPDGQTRSGTVVISDTTVARSELSLVGTMSADQVQQLFRFCDVYVRRRSDGAIQWVNCLRRIMGAA